MVYGLPVLITSLVYSGLGLWWAIAMFNREDVLFREAERFDVRLWIRHLLRDKEPIPSSTEAVICIVLIMLLQFGALRLMHGLVSPQGELVGDALFRLLIIQQFVFIGCPALFMARLLTTSVVNIAAPPAVVELPVDGRPHAAGSAPALVQLGCLVAEMVLPAAAGAVRRKLPARWVIRRFPGGLCFSPSPSRRPSARNWPFAGSSSAVLCDRLAPAWRSSCRASPSASCTWCRSRCLTPCSSGLLLGLFALRSGSLLPGIVFHLIFNGLEIVRERMSSLDLKGPVANWFITTTTKENEHLIEYNWSTLAIAAIIAALLIARLAPPSPAAGWVCFTTDCIDAIGRCLERAAITQADGRIPRFRKRVRRIRPQAVGLGQASRFRSDRRSKSFGESLFPSGTCEQGWCDVAADFASTLDLSSRGRADRGTGD